MISRVVAIAVLAAALSAQGPEDRYPFVNKDGKLGFIDSTGREVIAAQFQPIADMSHFNDGLAPVNGPEGSGYIDPSGRFVIGPTKEWGQPRQFSEGIAAVLIWAKTRGAHNTPAFIDRTGRIVLSDARVEESAYFSEGLMPMEEGDRWGFVDRNFRWVVPPQFAHAGALAEGLAPVKIGTKEGFVDRQGKTIIPPRYDDVWGFSNGAALVRLNGLFGYVDRGGREIIRTQFDHATYFRDERAFARAPSATHFMMINKSGVAITKPVYESVREFSEGLAAVQENGLWGFVDPNGEWMIRPTFLGAKGFWRGLANVVWKDGRGYIDKKGRTVWKSAS
jgi:hypothetical protein